MNIKQAKSIVASTASTYVTHHNNTITIAKAYLYLDRKIFIEGIGWAIRSPKDTPNQVLGSKIARGRALASLARQIVELAPALGLK